MTQRLMLSSAPVLRGYQVDAVESILRELSSVRGTIAVLATGMGKTVLFAELASRWPGRVLVLAHRDELVSQGASALERATGEAVDVEQGEMRAGSARVVMASVASLRGKRLARLAPEAFSLIIVDEAHHATATSYRSIFSRFSDAKIVGVTATPDRGDGKALAGIFQSVAFRMDIRDGISAGYLVPLRGLAMVINEVDVSRVSSRAGDLAAGELDEAMLKAVEGIARETLAILPPAESAILFAPGVLSARAIADRMNELDGGVAVFVSGATPPDERKEMVSRFKSGAARVFVNCMIATEGFDAPRASYAVIARPTKSRALYAQMVGRITRPEPGVVDGIESAEGRVAAIAGSRKPFGTIVDVSGNSGKHSLVGPADVLGVELDDDEKRAFKKRVSAGAEDVEKAIALSRQEIAALRDLARTAMETAVRTTRTEFDPFSLLHMNPDESGIAASARQRDALVSAGVTDEEASRMSRGDAQRVLGAIHIRRSKGLASVRQLRILRRFGIERANVSMKTASKLIDHFASVDWARSRVDMSFVSGVLEGRRVNHGK